MTHTKFPGVYWHPLSRRWRVQLRIRGRPTQIIMTHSLSLALVSFNAAAKEHYGSLQRWWQLRRGRHTGTPSFEVPPTEEELLLMRELFGKGAQE